MIDRLGRTIDYLRVSLTDRCNFRCSYCMPDSVPDMGHDAVLRYEEIVLVCQAAVRAGIRKFKVTGGEPLVRKGAVSCIAALKQMAGVQSVTMTTNGYALTAVLPQLAHMGIDGVTISLDSLDARQFQRITGVNGLAQVLHSLQASAAMGLPTKINAVLLEETKEQILPLARIAQRLPVDVRFIELMPLGAGKGRNGPDQDRALAVLRRQWPDLSRADAVRGNGPAVYYQSRSLRGYIGFIAANTHRFCPSCNRLRLTCDGMLKPCLCYSDGIDVRAILRGPGSDREAALQQAFFQAAAMKPAGHQFGDCRSITERKTMNQIGG